MSSEDSLYYFSTLTNNTQRTMNRQELISENLDEHAVIHKCDKNGDAGTDASERLDAVIAERDELKNRLWVMRQRLASVLAERDELKSGMRLWMAAARLWMAAAIINAVVLFITTLAF